MKIITASIQEAMTALCRRFRVERLYLFSSAADGRFEAGRSDLDFLVTLEDQPPGECSGNYLGLAQALEQLLQRRVDLVTETSIRNPYFREPVLATRRLLYDRRDEKVAA